MHLLSVSQNPFAELRPPSTHPATPASADSGNCGSIEALERRSRERSVTH